MVNRLLVPRLEALNVVIKTDYRYTLENSNVYINWYYRTLQHEYLLYHINEMLKIKDMKGVESFCESPFSSFVPLSDMENLLK
jgi:hypothetical protein